MSGLNQYWNLEKEGYSLNVGRQEKINEKH